MFSLLCARVCQGLSRSSAAPFGRQFSNMFSESPSIQSPLKKQTSIIMQKNNNQSAFGTNSLFPTNPSSCLGNSIRSITDSKRQDLTNQKRRKNILIYNRRVKIAKRMRKIWYGLKKSHEREVFQKKIDQWKKENL